MIIAPYGIIPNWLGGFGGGATVLVEYQYQIPGDGYINQVGAFQYQMPGGSYINETVS